ncbi:MAG TPA: tetratricopeptide repeat protein [Vicinamibacteria bacterium]|jgi:tetratricopeptide (TPR) repeat protein
MKKNALMIALLAGGLAGPPAALAACRTGSAESAPALAPAPDDSLQTGIALFQQGEYAKAEAALRQATGPDASAYLAASLAKQKKYAEAEAPARAAVEANPTNEIAVAALGAALVGQATPAKFDEAIEKMSEAIKRKPDLAYAYFWRGQAYYGKKKADRMVADFETFLKLAPKSPEAPIVRQLLSSLG